MNESKQIRKNAGIGCSGRPSKKTQELISKILERVTCGETIASISNDKEMPSEVTIYNWLRQDKEFSERLARARELGVYPILERLKERLEHAEEKDARTNDNYMKFIMWFAGKFNRQFGDQRSVELTGDKDKPLEISHSIPAEQLAQLAAIWNEIDDEESSV